MRNVGAGSLSRFAIATVGEGLRYSEQACLGSLAGVICADNKTNPAFSNSCVFGFASEDVRCACSVYF